MFFVFEMIFVVALYVWMYSCLPLVPADSWGGSFDISLAYAGVDIGVCSHATLYVHLLSLPIVGEQVLMRRLSVPIAMC